MGGGHDRAGHVRQGPVQRDEPRRAARTFFVNVPRYWPKRSGWSFRPRHTRSNSYIVFGASVGTAGARTLAFLAAGAAVEVGAAAGAAAGGAGGRSAAVAAAFVVAVVATVAGGVGGSGAVTSFTLSAACSFSLTRTSCATFVRSARRPSSWGARTRRLSNSPNAATSSGNVIRL